MSDRFVRHAYPVLLLAACAGFFQLSAHAQNDPRGRKYNPPPPVAHITVTVFKGTHDKPLESAAVVFHTIRDGKDQGNLELKTNEEGRAVIDVVPIGDTVRLQVIKNGYQTYGEDYVIDTNSRDIVVHMKPPTQQYSTYDKSTADPNTNQRPATNTPQPTNSSGTAPH